MKIKMVDKGMHRTTLYLFIILALVLSVAIALMKITHTKKMENNDIFTNP